MESKRIVYFDYLRVISVLSVIVLHVAAQNWNNVDTSTYEWNVFNVYDGASRWGVPIFVMISGALFLGQEHALNTLYRRHVLKMVIAFLFWSTAYSVWGNWIEGSEQTGKEILVSIIVGRYHLWFLPMIIGIYMIVPLLNEIVKDNNTAFYFLILSFIFSFLIPQAILIINLESIGLSLTLSKALSNANVHFVVGFSGYYVLGYILHNIDLKRKQLIILYYLGFCGLLVTVGATAWISVHFEEPKSIFYGDFTVNILVTAVTIFLWAKYNLNSTTLSVRRQRLLLRLSKCSFGIYLVHVFVIDGMKAFFNLTTLSFNAVLAVPVISGIVFIISYLLSALLNRIPVIKKWIV